LRRCRRGAAFEAEDRDRYVAKIKPNDGTIIPTARFAEIAGACRSKKKAEKEPT